MPYELSGAPPGLRGFLLARQNQQAEQQQELQAIQQAVGLRGLLMKQQQAAQEQARDQEFRSGLSALGPNPTQEGLAGLAAKYAKPGEILKTQQSSLDRQATIEAARINKEAQINATLTAARERIAAQIETAKQRGMDQRALAEMNMAGRKELMQMAQSLRQPRQEPAPVSVIGPDGKPVLVRREDAIGKRPAMAEKPLTEFQGKAILYGTRAAQSDKILKTLEDKISLPGMATAKSLGPLGNYVMSSEQQRVDQAQRDFVNAVLRQESGAVISDAEFANAQKQYFPVAGDDPKTIAQKRANRELAIKGFGRMAGPGAADIETVINAPLLPGGTGGASGGWTPDKEKRYQELLKKQGGG